MIIFIDIHDGWQLHNFNLNMSVRAKVLLNRGILEPLFVYKSKYKIW